MLAQTFISIIVRCACGTYFACLARPVPVCLSNPRRSWAAHLRINEYMVIPRRVGWQEWVWCKKTFYRAALYVSQSWAMPAPYDFAASIFSHVALPIVCIIRAVVRVCRFWPAGGKVVVRRMPAPPRVKVGPSGIIPGSGNLGQRYKRDSHGTSHLSA